MKGLQTHIPGTTVLTTILFVACCMIPLNGLYDKVLSPKWYLSICASMAILVCYGWDCLHGKFRRIDFVGVFSLSCHLVLWYCIVYALMCDILPNVNAGLNSVPIHGMFDNASGLSLNLCVLLAMSLMDYDQKCRMEKCSLVAAFILASAIIVLSRCRTGMICTACLVVCCLMKLDRIRKVVKICLALLLVCSSVLFAFLTKEESTSGRRFIMERSMEMVCRNPFTGHGLYGFEREYMMCQGEYFASHPDSPAGWYADEIAHPLNEFVYLWTDFGVVAPLALAALLLFPVFWYGRTRCEEIGLSLLPLFVVILFCFFSYPFKYPLGYVAVALPYLLMLGKPARVLLKQHRRTASLIMIVAGITVLTATLVEYSYERRWIRLIRISEAGGSKAVVDEFDELYEHYSCNPYFLYSDMVAQYKSGRCHKSMKLYDRLCEYQSGYNMELLAGDALVHLEEYDDALLHYRRAGCMCPVRFAPLCGMLEVYEQTNDTARADSVAHVILAKKVKIPSYVVDEIQNEAKMWLKRR